MSENRCAYRVAALVERYRTALIIVWAVYSTALLSASLLPGKSVPTVVLLGWDKLAHAVAFFGLGLVTASIVIKQPRWPWIVMGYGLIAAVLSEVLQLFVPGRSCSIWDVVADMLGITASIVVAKLWQKHQPRRVQAEGGS
jgi:VanZ family protein